MATSTATSTGTKPKWASSIFGTYPSSSSSSVSSSSSLSASSNSSSSSSSSSSICSPFLPSKSDINNKISKSSYCFGYSTTGGNGTGGGIATRSSDNNNKKSSYSFLNDAINNNNHHHHHNHNHNSQNNHHHHISSHYGSHSNLSNSRDKLKLSSIFNNNNNNNNSITGSGAKTTSKCKITKHEFVAHGSAVTCLALGQKSGRVMVTGGDDAKINLWAIGKPNCIMSLNGHRTSIECAKFNHNEDIVGAGSASGAIKLWDLEAAKLIQTLTGHKTNVRCLDFHPYGQFLASGSFDTSIKLWDYRKKGCIFTYKVHSKDVHCLKLSPDGRWLASGGNEGSVMLYDIVAGKMLSELKGHSASVTDVVFHPNEFLLTSSSSDGTVKFWDLESFQQVSTTNYQSDVGAIRKIAFHPEGKVLLTGAKDILKVYGWEPTRLHDSVPVNWSKLNDMAVLDDQLIAGTYSLTNVSVYMVDITTLQPFNYNSVKPSIYSRDNVLRQSTRRNFNFDQTNKTCKQLESLESNRTDDIETLGSDGDDSLAEIYNACDYKEIFQSRRELNRTPPPLELSCSSPSNDYNLRSLPETTLPHSYSISSLINKSNGNVANYLSSSSTLTPSARLMSESLSNIHLSNKNNNNNVAKLATNYTNSINNNHLISPNNILNNNNNNNHSSHNSNGLASTLTHAISLTALNHPKLLEAKPTFPVITPGPKSSSTIANSSSSNVHNSAYSSSCSPYNSATTTLTPLNGHSGTATSIVLPSASVPANIVSSSNNNSSSIGNATNTSISSFQTPNKITSVVRPVINDSNRPTSIAQPQPKITPFSESGYRNHNTTLASLDIGHNEKPSSVCLASHNSPNSRNNNDSTSFIIPETRDHSAGLDFNDFLPKHIQQYGYEAQPSVSEMEAITTIVKGHKAAKTGLDYRRKQVQIVLAMWATKDSKTALEYAVNLDEKSIIIDILNVMILKSSSWNLDICLIMLPCIQELLESKYESYMSVGCSALSLILKTFSSTIKNNISAPPGIGVDISREERYNKCMKCYNYLLSARAFVLKRQTLQGKIGRSFRELSILMQNLD